MVRNTVAVRTKLYHQCRRRLEKSGNVLYQRLFVCKQFSFHCPHHRAPTRIFHKLLSRDHETGNPLAGLSGAERARIRWACHLATAECWFRGIPERYVAGTDTRGRQEGRSYPWSQQVIHEISGLSFIPFSLTVQAPFLTLLRSSPHSGCNSNET